jgi:putative transcriptional regulator
MRRAVILFALTAGLVLQAGAQTIAAGQILVATRSLDDPSFSKTVILLIYVAKNGVVGLMLNRPVDHPVSEMIPEAKSAKESAWVGGVVPMGIFALVGGNTAPPGGVRLLPGVYLVADRKQIAELPPGPRLRIYAGNCGWTLPQLRNEMSLGVWRLVPATADAVFDKNPSSLWERLVASEYAGQFPPDNRRDSRTEANDKTSAAAIQPAYAAIGPSNLDTNQAGSAGATSADFQTAAAKAANTATQAAMPGKARFHGKASGGGSEASRRTASMTLAVKPDEGTMSSCRDNARSRSSFLITPPLSPDARPGARVSLAAYPFPAITVL